MKKRKKYSIGAAILAISIVGIIVMLSLTAKITILQNAQNQYFCDVKFMSLRLKIDVQDMEENHLYDIEGELESDLDDDLVMKNASQEIVCTVDDQYNLITQNNHLIYKNGELQYSCNGKVKLLADSYDIYNAENTKIAQVKFNILDTKGVMTNMEGEKIAEYSSSAFNKDYVVSIYEECPLDQESVLMIFASYVSDSKADSRTD